MSAQPWILGLSTGHHNGAACLLHGNELVVAIQEERLTRVKRDRLRQDRKSLAVRYCLDAAGIRMSDLDAIVNCTIGGPVRGSEPLLRSALLSEARSATPIMSIPHHVGHAISAFATSGFSDSIALVIDGGGSFGWELSPDERAVSHGFESGRCEHLSIYQCSPTGVVAVEKHLSDMSYLETRERSGMLPFASLGHMFSSAALQIFGDYFTAGKVMALASFGAATIPDDELVRWVDGSFEFSTKAVERFPYNERWPSHEREYEDLSASVQHALESILTQVCQRIRELGLGDRLCYAGGVALNSVANRKVLRESGIFSDIHVLAAAEDSGPAIGAAYHGLMLLCGTYGGKPLRTDYLGRTYAPSDIDEAIASFPGVAVMDTPDVLEATVDLLCDGNTVGWHQGGAEFGPRALGHRSILCDPRRPDAKQILNSRIKFRESFRPFAPAVLAEEASKWFEIDEPTEPMEFMLEVCRFRSDLPVDVPAVFHVDGTGRLQVVRRDGDERLYQLLTRFFARTGVPILVNTSLNIQGEPIVETPLEALWLLYSTGLDYCIVGDRLLRKLGDRPILSLVPYTTCTITKKGGASSALARTPHGDHEYDRLPPAALELLAAIDGQKTGHALLNGLGAEFADGVKLTRALGQLFRYSLIRFHEQTPNT
jgi:carbamoyltransferase